MRYPCLVVDHDDTVLNSTATVHYPCFVEYTGIYHAEVHYTLEEYIKYNFDPGVVAFFCDIIGMSRAETERAVLFCYSEKPECSAPPELEIISDVTGKAEYKNKQLAKSQTL